MKALIPKLIPVLFASLSLNVIAATTHYVDLNSPSPTPPYTNWLTAATNIQDAIDAAVVGGEIVVTNGVYQTGGKVMFGSMTNRVAVNRPLTVRSVNGPEVTVIQGYRVPGTTNGNSAVRCVYLTNGAFLSGFTLTNGATRTSGDLIVDGRGGALWCGSTNAWASNCVIVGNSSHDRGGAVYQGTLISCTLLQNFTSGYGGGSAFGAMFNCTLKSNSAAAYGGASYFDVMYSCTLSNNSAGFGGGANLSTLNNCGLFGNRATDAGGAAGGVLNNCTLTGNSAVNYGGGNSGGILSNCVISANTARYGGGGSYEGTLIDCLITGNFATNQGGGVVYAMLNNCTVTNNWSGSGGGTANSVLNNCVVISNSAVQFGGGASSGTLTNCTLIGNSATFGGGAYSSTLNGCTVTGNQATSSGGGVYVGTATNCVISGNFAGSGGGANGGQLKNCTLTGNTASYDGGGSSGFAIMENCRIEENSAARGGGSYYGSLKNCVVARNSASEFGGGSYYGGLTNCTVSGNTAGVAGGGAYQGMFYNSIVYFNSSASSDNYLGSNFNYSCTTPLPPAGTGNISSNPLLVSASHLSATSPCIGTGSASHATGKDIDGQPWAAPPSMGCDEYSGGAVGPLSLTTIASHLYVGVGFVVNFSADIRGHAAMCAWDFGDGTVVSNHPYASHAWSTPGDYSVILRAYNDSWPAGLTSTVIVRVKEQWVHHVSASGVNPMPPYDSWATAATNIQNAIAIAPSGALILVTNGLYASGGKAVFGTITNRIVVGKPVTVRSVNGPEFTIIQGRQVPGVTNGDGAIRCAFLANGAALNGFTLTNGATRAGGNEDNEQNGGGVWCASTNVWITNCVVVGNAAKRSGGGVFRGTLNNCLLLTNNAASLGGGCHEANLNFCTVTGNSASAGGGTSYSAVDNCLVSANVSTFSGGGCRGGTVKNSTVSGNSCGINGGGGTSEAELTDCLLSGNYSATWGGGSQGGTLSGCTLIGNSASTYGGGAYNGLLRNCMLTDNSSGDSGGGAFAGTLTNCTVTGNSAGLGGGIRYVTANNCIVYFNTATTAGSNYYDSTLNYSCTLPLSEGEGNIDQNPLLASSSHLSAASPCIGSGSTNYATGTDIDGEPWASPPSMGCDEYWSGSATGALSVVIRAGYTNVAVGFVVNFACDISGHASANAWDFGDGTVVSNHLHASHSWATPGNYAVVLRAYNETWPSGVSATTIVHVVNTIHHVAANGVNPVPPYDSWATAATNIQDALDAAIAPGTTILVTNGVYASGGKVVFGLMTNRVFVNKFLTLRSVNGPQFTTIRGHQVPGTTNGAGAIRCAYVAENATLIGFTLAQGATCAIGDLVKERSGGGLWCESKNVVVSNCVITGNAAHAYGGGVYDGTLTHCLLRNNSANSHGGGCYEGVLNNCALAGNFSGNRGGGAYQGTLNHSTITGNTASSYGGGMYEAVLKNCIVYFNTSVTGLGDNFIGGYCDSPGALDYCCTTPQPLCGSGNITNAPSFMDTNGWSNLRLETNSPCINAGNNSYSTAGVDLDGNPRVAGGTVDIGAYEFQSPISLLSYAWAQQHGLAFDGSEDFTDEDGDGMNNYGEWRSDTIHTNSLSVLRMMNVAIASDGVDVTWDSVATRSYWLECATNLGNASPFQTIATNIPGASGTTTFTDTRATNSGPYFYRVGVQ